MAMGRGTSGWSRGPPYVLDEVCEAGLDVDGRLVPELGTGARDVGYRLLDVARASLGEDAFDGPARGAFDEARELAQRGAPSARDVEDPPRHALARRGEDVRVD